MFFHLILAQTSVKPVFLKLTCGAPGKRLACVVAEKVKAVTFMCCDGSSDERRWILRIRAVKSGDDESDGRFVAECSGGDDIFILLSSQLLYSTYLLSSTRRTIGVDEGMSREVHDRMTPAFEELFDEVEEHALNLLLEPWTLLVNQDRESFQKVMPALLFHVQGDFFYFFIRHRSTNESNSPFRLSQMFHVPHMDLNLFSKLFVVNNKFLTCVRVKVCVWKDVRCVNSPEYQELQSLYEDSQLKLKQVSQFSPDL